MLGSHRPERVSVCVLKGLHDAYPWVEWAVEIHPIGRGIVAICKLDCSHFSNYHSPGIDESLKCGSGGITRRIQVVVGPIAPAGPQSLQIKDVFDSHAQLYRVNEVRDPGSTIDLLLRVVSLMWAYSKVLTAQQRFSSLPPFQVVSGNFKKKTEVRFTHRYGRREWLEAPDSITQSSLRECQLMIGVKTESLMHFTRLRRVKVWAFG